MEEFFDYDEFPKKFHGNFTGEIKQTHIFLIDENNQESTKQGIQHKLILTMKQCDHPKLLPRSTITSNLDLRGTSGCREDQNWKML